jgi:hypothetical protein
MQFPVGILGCVLAIGSAALAVSDYSSGPVESPERLQLGRFYLTDDRATIEDAFARLNDLGASGALKVFRPALERDPGSAYRWTTVCKMLIAAGDRPGADYCYHRADLLAPHEANILFDLGDYDASVKNTTGAVSHFSRVLAVAHNEDEAVIVQNVFGYYEQLKVRDRSMLDAAIPDALSARLYLRYLESHTEPAGVRSVWRWMHTKGYDDGQSTNDYLGYLFAKKQFAEAADDWHAHLTSREHPLNNGYPAKNAVFNGGFEEASTGSPFDWEFDSVNGVTVTRDDTIHHDGNYSTRIDFAGKDNPEFRSFRQTVFVTPGHYRVEGFMKTAAITSGEGVRILVTNPSNNAILAETEALRGTNDFTPVSASFDVPAGTTIVNINLARRRALRIDNQLTGQAWLDSVSITRER